MTAEAGGGHDRAMASERENLDRVVAALMSRLSSPSCPMCHQSAWSAGQLTLQPDPPSFPLKLVALTCSHCGFIAFHDEEALGGSQS